MCIAMITAVNVLGGCIKGLDSFNTTVTVMLLMLGTVSGIAVASTEAQRTAETLSETAVVRSAEWAQERYGMSFEPGEIGRIIETAESGLLLGDNSVAVSLVPADDGWLMMTPDASAELPLAN